MTMRRSDLVKVAMKRLHFFPTTKSIIANKTCVKHFLWSAVSVFEMKFDH